MVASLSPPTATKVFITMRNVGAENNLPAVFDGVAVITADTAGAQFVVVTNNASNQFFYTFISNN